MGKQPGTRTPRSRGAYGSTRGKERQRRRADNRSRDPRYQAAQAATQQAQDELEALISHQKEFPNWGATEGAFIDAQIKQKEEALAARQAEQKIIEDEPEIEDKVSQPVVEVNRPRKFSVKRLPQDGEGKFPFASVMARQMLRSGYNITYVIEFTGIGYLELDDIEIDSEGFGVIASNKPDDEEEEESA